MDRLTRNMASSYDVLRRVANLAGPLRLMGISAGVFVLLEEVSTGWHAQYLQDADSREQYAEINLAATGQWDPEPLDHCVGVEIAEKYFPLEGVQAPLGGPQVWQLWASVMDDLITLDYVRPGTSAYDTTTSAVTRTDTTMQIHALVRDARQLRRVTAVQASQLAEHSRIIKVSAPEFLKNGVAFEPAVGDLVSWRSSVALEGGEAARKYRVTQVIPQYVQSFVTLYFLTLADA